MFSNYIIESYYVFNSLIKKILNAQPNLTQEQKTQLRSELKALNNKDLVNYYNSTIGGIPNQTTINTEDDKESEGSE